MKFIEEMTGLVEEIEERRMRLVASQLALLGALIRDAAPVASKVRLVCKTNWAGNEATVLHEVASLEAKKGVKAGGFMAEGVRKEALRQINVVFRSASKYDRYLGQALPMVGTHAPHTQVTDDRDLDVATTPEAILFLQEALAKILCIPMDAVLEASAALEQAGLEEKLNAPAGSLKHKRKI